MRRIFGAAFESAALLDYDSFRPVQPSKGHTHHRDHGRRFSRPASTQSVTGRTRTPGGKSLSIAQRWQEVRTGFERPFWVANISEIFERLSYYAVFAALA